MKLTKEYIRDVKFERSKKGYDTEQVDDFLDLVSSEFEELQSQIEKSKSELQKYRDMEATLTSVLVSAESNAKKLEEEARVRASAIIAETEEAIKKQRIALESEEYVYREKLAKDRERMETQIQELRRFHQQYKETILADIERFRARLLEEEQSVEEVWQEKPEAVREPAAAVVKEKADVEQAAGGSFDLSAILKDLPETDGELKAIIDELI